MKATILIASFLLAGAVVAGPLAAPAQACGYSAGITGDMSHYTAPAVTVAPHPEKFTHLGYLGSCVNRDVVVGILNPSTDLDGMDPSWISVHITSIEPAGATYDSIVETGTTARIVNASWDFSHVITVHFELTVTPAPLAPLGQHDFYVGALAETANCSGSCGGGGVKIYDHLQIVGPP
jgi:hypothetical protein